MQQNQNIQYYPGTRTPSQTRDAEFCMRNCGCYNPGYPGGSGFRQYVTLSGRVYGVDGRGAGQFPMSYSVNGNYFSRRTDAVGRYAVSGEPGSDISAAPMPGLGVTVTPPSYSYTNMRTDQTGKDFQLRAVSPGIGSGAPQ